MKKQLAYGIHTITSLLEHHADKIKKLYLLESRQGKKILQIIQLAEKQHIPVAYLPKHAFNKLITDANYQGVVAELLSQNQYHEQDLENLLMTTKGPLFLLILDGVQDPHNLGACLRSADAVGVHAVITPKDRSSPLTSLARKVASGAAENVPLIQVTNLARTLRLLQKHNIWIYGLSDAAENNLFQADLTGNVALVLGAEGKGLRRLTKEHCDNLFYVPMLGTVSSLNVSVAAGVCLYEALRQRVNKIRAN